MRIAGWAAALATTVGAPLYCQTAAATNQEFPPFQVMANVYYIGTAQLASYLITGDQGSILINPDFESSVPFLQASVSKLGFHFSDIKIVLLSHAHDDHAGGTALIKKLTGARLMVMDGDVAEIEGGGAGDFQYHDHWPPAKVDRTLHDGDEVALGSARVVAHKTPGHTPGCTTWTTEVRQDGKRYQVVIVGSPNVNPGYRLRGNKQYAGIVADYERTFRVLRSLPCDIFLGAHGAYFDLPAKYQRWKAGDRLAFVDLEGYKRYVNDREKAFREELRRQ